MGDTILKGITWGHSRGITPLLAFSQRFMELNPGVQVSWEKRSLQEFADFPIEKLALQYDLLIVDHPWVGCAAATGCVLPLDEYLPAAYLQDQAANSVGHSHESYVYANHQWALAIDAATPVASYRADLLQANNQPIPQNWEDVLHLAAKGKIAVPGIPIDILMNFYMFCIAAGTEPFISDDEVIDKNTGLAALELMRQLYSFVDKRMFQYNPIAVAEQMTTTDDYWYCPFAYGYSNYSRQSYANHLLTYADLVAYKNRPLQSTLGGTGLSVSATSKNIDTAIAFANDIVSGNCQSGLYVENGGQPGHRSAWLGEHSNRLTNNFFSNTLPTLDRAFVRPRFNGYLHFQDTAGTPVREYLMSGGDAGKVLESINGMYCKSQVRS